MTFCGKFLYDELPPRLQEEVDVNGYDQIESLFEGLTLEETDCLKANLLSNLPLASTRGVNLERYITSVKYVSLVLTGSSKESAYKSVFPKRYQQWLDQNKSQSQIRKSIENFDKSNRTVNQIRDRLLVPVHIMYQSGYHLAIESQIGVLNDDGATTHSKIKAADSLMTHLKPPETGREHFDEVVEQRQDKFLETLQSVTDSLAIAQQKAIMNKSMTTQQIAENGIKVLEGEVVERT